MRKRIPIADAQKNGRRVWPIAPAKRDLVALANDNNVLIQSIRKDNAIAYAKGCGDGETDYYKALYTGALDSIGG